MTPITIAWITALLLSWTGGTACTEVTILQAPTPQEPFVQLLGTKVADVHAQTVTVALVDGSPYRIVTQETTRYYGDDAVPLAFQVYINQQHVAAGGPRLDVELRPRPAWCSLPTGTPLHP